MVKNFIPRFRFIFTRGITLGRCRDARYPNHRCTERRNIFQSFLLASGVYHEFNNTGERISKTLPREFPTDLFRFFRTIDGAGRSFYVWDIDRSSGAAKVHSAFNFHRRGTDIGDSPVSLSRVEIHCGSYLQRNTEV